MRDMGDSKKLFEMERGVEKQMYLEELGADKDLCKGGYCN